MFDPIPILLLQATYPLVTISQLLYRIFTYQKKLLYRIWLVVGFAKKSGWSELAMMYYNYFL
jgi:hypothetical protein